MLGAAPSGGEREALWTALDDLRRTQALYDAVLAHPGNAKLRPFRRIVREKHRHERRLVKVTLQRGHADPPVLWDRRDVEAPADRTAACARAVDQELRNAAIYETAMALPLGARVMRAMRRMHRRVRNRHIPSFEACVRLS